MIIVWLSLWIALWIMGLYYVADLMAFLIMFFIRRWRAPTRRGRVGSKPLMGGATPPTKAQDCRASPALGGAERSEACPHCHAGWATFEQEGVIYHTQCNSCFGTGKRIAPPNGALHRQPEARIPDERT